MLIILLECAALRPKALIAFSKCLLLESTAYVVYCFSQLSINCLHTLYPSGPNDVGSTLI